eukprot:scaffold8597_cov174-Skeletonema_dohrnii-CCMP3373.AAC.2
MAFLDTSRVEVGTMHSVTRHASSLSKSGDKSRYLQSTIRKFRYFSTMQIDYFSSVPVRVRPLISSLPVSSVKV